MLRLCDIAYWGRSRLVPWRTVSICGRGKPSIPDCAGRWIHWQQLFRLPCAYRCSGPHISLSGGIVGQSCSQNVVVGITVLPLRHSDTAKWQQPRLCFCEVAITASLFTKRNRRSFSRFGIMIASNGILILFGDTLMRSISATGKRSCECSISTGRTFPLRQGLRWIVLKLQYF